jgi:hypothetical protein
LAIGWIFDRSTTTAASAAATTAPTMATTPVWVLLYYELEERVEMMQDNAIDIGLAEIRNGNISGLARRLKENDMKNDLSHCDRGRIRVYPPGTKPPFSQDKVIDPGDPVPTGTTSRNPLIVVAPDPTTPVWVLLYYTGEEDNHRDPVEIEPPLPKNIGALKTRLKENELREELQNCGLSGIKIYTPGTKPPFSLVDSIPPGRKFADLTGTPPTSDDHPLIVVAPDPKQADGKKCFRFGCWFIVEFIPVA